MLFSRNVAGGGHVGAVTREGPPAELFLADCIPRAVGRARNRIGDPPGYRLALAGKTEERPEAPWTATIHSTFAATYSLTALSEGFAIHLETLWGHYGSDPERRAFYHRLSPRFDERGRSVGRARWASGIRRQCIPR